MRKPSLSSPTDDVWHLTVDGTAVSLAITHRTGTLAPVLFLHGFGSTKEDFTDFLLKQAFDKYAFIAYDAPGCGQSSCTDPSQLSIPFLVQTAEATLEVLGADKFHLVGHSMGALTALELAAKHPQRVLSFTNIKGNLAPEDCFLSRQIFDYPESDTGVFFEDFVQRTAKAPLYGSAFYAASLHLKARHDSVRPIFSSMVKLSDEGDLLSKFLALPCPRTFMFGEQYSWLSYLPKLAANGVHLANIPDTGHFPMYSNPVAMWQYILQTIELGESAAK
ncbi:putative hydrolase or acyltransferase of alpha/beta superfamily [Dactylonectria macrodidyma]|uniref:Hydrolase or acyltransferase of alpha/beta superfamily n=1 Tax=Dactylonectria macrodidyma TaxID=307937 RepID=A0A9P9ESB4_9HYPO|nr:putative hydrolase or acyltransferase of alpha/beta superfamily [Dactylonectria macrodidyma]